MSEEETPAVVSEAARREALRQWETVDPLKPLPDRVRLAAGRVHNSDALSQPLKVKVARAGDAQAAANDAVAAFVAFSEEHLPFRVQADEVEEQAAEFLKDGGGSRKQGGGSPAPSGAASAPGGTVSSLDALIEERRVLYRAALHAIELANQVTSMVQADLAAELVTVEVAMSERIAAELLEAQGVADSLVAILAKVASSRGEAIDIRNAAYPGDHQTNDSNPRLHEARALLNRAVDLVGGIDE